jgi:hypothetical protein
MHDSALVEVFKSRTCLSHVFTRLVDRQRPAILHQSPEVNTLYILHDSKRQIVYLSLIECSQDMGMFKSGDHAGFSSETIDGRRVPRRTQLDDLDRNNTLRAKLFGFVDSAHPAFTQEVKDFVSGNVGDFQTGYYTSAAAYRTTHGHSILKVHRSPSMPA